MKKLISNYTFDPVAKTVTFNDYASIDLESLLLITNVTYNTIIYNFADATTGGGVNGNTVTLTYNTSGMGSTDALQIYYDDTSINPASDETLESLVGLTEYLKILINQSKTLATQDALQRQRVIVDNGLINVFGTITNIPFYGELVVRQESSRNQFANAIRSNLIF
jgi:hypothetical protein